MLTCVHNCGKVCLSLLGTWAGQNQSQGWQKQSTLLQVLVSIQSAILGVKYPYVMSEVTYPVVDTISL